MAELNLKQIVDKLNTEFTREHRKLVFWYDNAADFAENIDSMELENARVYKLTKDNQFSTKYLLQCTGMEIKIAEAGKMCVISVKCQFSTNMC